jgi:hypothetical protein
MLKTLINCIPKKIQLPNVSYSINEQKVSPNANDELKQIIIQNGINGKTSTKKIYPDLN